MKLFLTYVAVLLSFALSAQQDDWKQLSYDLSDHEGHRHGEDVNYCGQHHLRDILKANVPGFAAQYEQDQADRKAFIRDYAANHYEADQLSRGGNYIIPVVFHVVHNFGSENISDDQVMDALEVLNRDFNAGNADQSEIAPVFTNLFADVGVEFRLAQKDPQGNCHPGITRTISVTTNDGDFNMVTAIQDVHGAWPSNRYMNVFICANAAGSAGYTNLPSGWPPANSGYAGIWIDHAYVGRIGTGNEYRSRALTHEVGHWLGLPHTWGPNNSPGNQASCNDDDGISDTPNTIGSNLFCDTSYSTCGSRDNVQNYMEYSYCSVMYTNGQKTEMIGTLNSGTGGRSNLWSNANLNFTGVNQTPALCEAEFSSQYTVICVGDSIQFSDMSYNAATSWDWTFGGGSPAASTDENPWVTYDTPGTYDVSLEASDGTTNDTETKSQYIVVLPAGANPTPFSEGFENVTSLPNSNWFILNSDGSNGWDLSASAAYDGSRSLKMNNYNYDEGQEDEFISTSYDLSNASSVLLTFRYAYKQRQTSNLDKLQILVSRDCGQTWSMRKQLSGTQLSTTGTTQNTNYTPSGQGDWEYVEVTNILSNYFGPNFRFKFKFISGGGNNLYLDNINLDVTLSMDAENGLLNTLNVYPNPLENESVVDLSLSQSANVSITVHDIVGQKVKDVRQGNLSQGEHRFPLNMNNYAAGVYMVRVQAGKEVYSRRVVVK